MPRSQVLGKGMGAGQRCAGDHEGCFPGRPVGISQPETHRGIRSDPATAAAKLVLAGIEPAFKELTGDLAIAALLELVGDLADFARVALGGGRCERGSSA